MTQGTVPAPVVQMYYNYDRAFVDKVHSLIYYTQDSSKKDVQYNLPCVFATPDRAFAQIKKQIARKTDKKEEDIKKIPLPIASLSRITQSLDLTRYVKYKFNRLYHDPENEKYIGMDRPSPWDLTYQVDIWARTIADLDMLTSQIIQWMRADEFYLPVDHLFPMGTKIVLTQFQGMVENSKVNHGTEDKRTLRRTFTYVVHGWISHPPIDAPIVKKIVVDFYDNTDAYDPVFLEQIVIYENEEDAVMGQVTTTFDVTLIPGELTVGESYGSFATPSLATIVGLQASILGDVAVGDDIELQLTIDGVVDSARKLVIAAGEVNNEASFDSVSVNAGQILGVYCASAGSVDPGSWLQVRVNVQLEVFA